MSRMTFEETVAWLNTLKPGDFVASPSHNLFGETTYEVYKIQRILPSKIEMVNGTVIRRRRDGYPQEFLEPMTQEIADTNKKAKLTYKLEVGVKWRNLSLAQLEAIEEIVKESI